MFWGTLFEGHENLAAIFYALDIVSKDFGTVVPAFTMLCDVGGHCTIKVLYDPNRLYPDAYQLLCSRFVVHLSEWSEQHC